MHSTRIFTFRKYIAPSAVGFYLATYLLPLSSNFALLGLTLGAVGVIFFSQPSSAQHWPWADLLAITFILGSVVSIMRSGQPQISIILFTPFIPATLIYLLTTRFISDPKGAWLVIFCMGIGECISSGIIVVNLLMQGFHPENIISKQLTPIFFVPNDLLLFSISAPLFIVLALHAKSAMPKILAGFAIILCISALVIVESRSAVIVLASGIAIVLIILGARQLTLAMMGCLAWLLIVDGARGFPLLDKFFQISLCNPRLALWAAAANLWVQKPILGFGANSFGDLYYEQIDKLALPVCTLIDDRHTPWPHNLFLEIFSSQGLLGGLPFFALLFLALSRSITAARQSESKQYLMGIGLLGSTMAFMLAGLLELTLAHPWVIVSFATIVGLSINLNVTRLFLIR